MNCSCKLTSEALESLEQLNRNLNAKQDDGLKTSLQPTAVDLEKQLKTQLLPRLVEQIILQRKLRDDLQRFTERCKLVYPELETLSELKRIEEKFQLLLPITGEKQSNTNINVIPANQRKAESNQKVPADIRPKVLTIPQSTISPDQRRGEDVIRIHVNADNAVQASDRPPIATQHAVNRRSASNDRRNNMNYAYHSVGIPLFFFYSIPPLIAILILVLLKFGFWSAYKARQMYCDMANDLCQHHQIACLRMCSSWWQRLWWKYV